LRELNPNIPYSPEEVASDAIATCRTGAALIHFHVRDPQTGRWVQDVPHYSEVYRDTDADVNSKCDADRPNCGTVRHEDSVVITEP
jgi:uncharacterized protein (DUF849 family)